MRNKTQNIENDVANMKKYSDNRNGGRKKNRKDIYN
jgi:hypothetical protein